MSRNSHTGNRKDRNHRNLQRTPELGYYYILTDTDETEKNYFEGLKQSLSKENRTKIVIKVDKVRTEKLLQSAVNYISQNPQYRKVWIVFDRDQVKDFDCIVTDATKRDIKVGWSNPCIETWFYNYFNCNPQYETSVDSCSHFEKLYKNKTPKKYKKNNPEIYQDLVKFGDEKVAIKIAKKKYTESIQNSNCKEPSQLTVCTTLYQLVEEIKQKDNNK